MKDGSLTPVGNDALLQWLWRWRYSPDGHMAACRRCDRPRKHHRVRGRPAWQCDACGTHVHPTAGTFLERTRLPLETWLRATLALCSVPALSVRQLQTDLNVTYKTAWRLHRVIRPRLPRGLRLPHERSGDEALRIFRAVLSADGKDLDHGAIAGRTQRRKTRAQRRLSEFGTGSLRAREPQEERILQAACVVLVQRGYGAARMKDIAAEAQVSLAALYSNFENREDLLLSAVDWANRQGTLEREAIIARNCSAKSKLSSFLELAVPSGQIREEHALYLDLWSRVGGEEALRPMVIRARERWHRYFREIITEGVASGEFHPRADLEDSVAIIVALQTGIGVETIVQFDWMPEERARGLLAAFVAKELGINAAELAAGVPAPGIDRGRSAARATSVRSRLVQTATPT